MKITTLQIINGVEIQKIEMHGTYYRAKKGKKYLGSRGMGGYKNLSTVKKLAQGA